MTPQQTNLHYAITSQIQLADSTRYQLEIHPPQCGRLGRSTAKPQEPYTSIFTCGYELHQSHHPLHPRRTDGKRLRDHEPTRDSERKRLIGPPAARWLVSRQPYGISHISLRPIRYWTSFDATVRGSWYRMKFGIAAALCNFFL